MTIFDTNPCVRPVHYPQFITHLNDIQDSTWFLSIINFADDLRDFNEKLNDHERQAIVNILSGFTAADNEIRNAWIRVYGSVLSGHPEVSDVIATIAAQEAVHTQFYSELILTLNLPEQTFSDFLTQEPAIAKLDPVINSIGSTDPATMLKNIVEVSVCGEGIQLFSAFQILMSFGAKEGYLMGCFNGNLLSARDELRHLDVAMDIFNIIKSEFPEIWTGHLKRVLSNKIKKAAISEMDYATFVLEGRDLRGLSLHDIHEFIEYIANKRLIDCGLEPVFQTIDLPKNSRWWISAIESVTHGNFFEGTVTEYSQSGFTGGLFK